MIGHRFVLFAVPLALFLHTQGSQAASDQSLDGTGWDC
jgi:hypothetical protein